MSVVMPLQSPNLRLTHDPGCAIGSNEQLFRSCLSSNSGSIRRLHPETGRQEAAP
jgi:hypothetical protein